MGQISAVKIAQDASDAVKAAAPDLGDDAASVVRAEHAVRAAQAKPMLGGWLLRARS